MAQHWQDEKLLSKVIYFLTKIIWPCLNEDVTSIKLFSACKMKGLIIRADPCYKQVSMWNDWMFVNGLKVQPVKGNEENKIPVQVISFVEIKGIKQMIKGLPRSPQPTKIQEDGVYALAHYVPVPLSHPNKLDNLTDHKAHQGSLLMDYARKTEIFANKKKQRDLILIDMKDFHSTCIGVPDFEPKDAKRKYSFIFLKSRSMWMDIFRQHMKESAGKKIGRPREDDFPAVMITDDSDSDKAAALNMDANSSDSGYE